MQWEHFSKKGEKQLIMNLVASVIALCLSIIALLK